MGIVERVFLRWLMDKAGVSQRALAGQIGCSQTTLNRLLNGQTSTGPGGNLLAAIQQAYLVDRSNINQDPIILDPIQFIQVLLHNPDQSEHHPLLTPGDFGRVLESPYRIDPSLDRLTLLFDVLPEHWETVIQNVQSHAGSYWPTSKEDKNPYWHNRKLKGLCHLSWSPRFNNVSRWARVEFFGRALGLGYASEFFRAQLLPYVVPGSVLVSRVDVAIDQLSNAPLSRLLVPYDSQVGSWSIRQPGCPCFRSSAFNVLHGSRNSPRSLNDYDKGIERIYHDCKKATGPWHSRKFPADCLECAPVRIDPHVHRSEACLKPPPSSYRSVPGFLLSQANPFMIHRLIHLGVIDDLYHLAIMVAAKVMGLRALRKDLEAFCRTGKGLTQFKAEFAALVEYLAAETSKVMAQPKDVFEAHRQQLQAQLDTFSGPTSPASVSFMPRQIVGLPVPDVNPSGT